MHALISPKKHRFHTMQEPHSVAPKRQGLSRVLHAFLFSLAGLRAGWHEPAFRQEAILAILILPAAWWLGQSWVEVVLLVSVLVLVLVVELLNSGIESAIDRIGPEWHVLSKRAKDMGSAAVLLSLLLCGGVWLSALWRWWVS
jgi:diacylglycerol kinase (ATP)